MEKILFNVKGMSCQHCVDSINKAVGGLKGVDEVNVSLSEETVSVVFNPAKINKKQLEEAIEDQGFLLCR